MIPAGLSELATSFIAEGAGLAMKRWEGVLAGQEVEGGHREGQIMQGFPDHLRTWVSP